MGNKLFSQITEKPVCVNEEDSETLLVSTALLEQITEPTTVIEPEPTMVIEPEPTMVIEPEPTMVIEPEPTTVIEPEPSIDISYVIKQNDFENIVESLSKSLPIDIPVLEQTSNVIKHTKVDDSEVDDSEVDDSEVDDSEVDGLSRRYTTEEWGLKTPQNSEESDISSDEAVLELEE